MKRIKLEEKLAHRLTKITNRSLGQTQFLFELCDYDFEKLLDAERKIWNNFLFCCPGTKKELNRILDLGYGSGWYDKLYGKLTWKKCQPMVRVKSIEFQGAKMHGDIPELIGLMTAELKENRCDSCRHLKFKGQLGIYWIPEYLSKWIQNKGGLPYFWNDKDEFQFARPYTINDEILWDWNYELNKPE